MANLERPTWDCQIWILGGSDMDSGHVGGFISNNTIKYEMLMQVLYLFLDMEPSTCPESISDNPKSDFSSWPSAAGIIRFYSEHFFEKVDLPQALWNFVQEQKVTSGDPLLINFFKKSSD